MGTGGLVTRLATHLPQAGGPGTRSVAGGRPARPFCDNLVAVPERPDLEYVVDRLHREVTGQRIEAFTVRKPVVLRMAVEGDPQDRLRGRSIQTVRRRAHFVLFELSDGLEIVVSPMLAGRFALVSPSDKRRADLAASWLLAGGQELRYRDNKQMGKIYLIEGGQHSKVPGLSPIGLDVLDPQAFSHEHFVALANKRRDQVRVFLMDKSALDALGNAYADEVLWQAKIHPKAWVRSLGEERLRSLHDAIVQVLSDARQTIFARQPALDEKLRDFLKVRGKHGSPCPRCQSTIRKAGVRGYDAYFCPQCQPDDRGSSIVNWSNRRR